MTDKTFEAFGFTGPLKRALNQAGYVTPTPIQSQTLSPQLAGRDLLGLAETGSGKTAAFLLPVLQRIAEEPVALAPKRPQTLVLAPTRELAIQIDQEAAKLSSHMRVSRAVVLGGVSKGPQIAALKHGVHILIATPGRLLDLINMRSCDLSAVRTLIIDEADRMFDMGFIRDIRKIVSMIPAQRRTALFSATMPDEIKKFAYDILRDPFRADLSPKSVVVDRIDQKVMMVRAAEKQSRLHTILANPACARVIVFTRTKRGADRVAARLAIAGIDASAIHGNKAQNARQRALSDFASGHVRVLVATDIAARGIDISNVTHVVNFDVPVDPETYVHRVGRTARKGLTGFAITLADPSERAEVQAIERLMKQKIETIPDVGGETLPAPDRRSHAPRFGGHPKRSEHTAGRHEAPKPRSRHTASGDRAHASDGRKGNRTRDEHRDRRVSHEGAATFGVRPRREHEPRNAHQTSNAGAPWTNGETPKFMRRRDGDRPRGVRNPAS